MIKFENTEVMGWEAAIRGMRNPMNSWERSDSGICPNGTEFGYCYLDHRKYCPRRNTDGPAFCIGPEDLDLMTRLRNAGTDHRKFMRMIAVYVDITAPLYWWKEFDTYKVGTVANSCSTMHKIADKEFTLDDFSHEHLFKADDVASMYYSATAEEELTSTDVLMIVIEALNVARNKYNEASKKLKRTDLTEAERKHVMAQKKLFWWQMIQLLPSSYNQRRTVMLNYEVLTNMYRSRKSHKLDEWHVFCDWIKTLPYSELITGDK